MLRFVCLTSSQSPLAKALKTRHPHITFDQPGLLLTRAKAHYIYLPLFDYQYLSINWSEMGIDLDQIDDLFFVSPRAVEAFAHNLPPHLKHLPQSQLNQWIKQRHCYAVGQTTAQSIYQHFGQTYVIAPNQYGGEQALSATILSKGSLTSFQHRKGLWLRGTNHNTKYNEQITGNGAESLLHQLQQHASQLRAIAVYQRLPVDWSAALARCTTLMGAMDETKKIPTRYYWDLFTSQAPKVIAARWQHWHTKHHLINISITHRAICHHPNVKASAKRSLLFDQLSRG
jgi:uroporphyrinogen-III synthase